VAMLMPQRHLIPIGLPWDPENWCYGDVVYYLHYMTYNCHG